MPKYWFRPKSIGFGSTPNTWQGWASTAVYVAVLITLLRTTHGPVKWVSMIALTIGFIIFALAKTGE